MASSYLDLYSSAGHLRQGGALGTSSAYNPTGFQWGGTPQNVFYQAGENQKVVHDTLNNKYYGTQKQTDLVSGLQDSIARIEAQLNQESETRYSTGWMGSLNSTNYRYTAQDRVDQNATLKSQQSYLNHINNGNYKQEASTFFDSYDAYTGDYNNIYQRTHNNTQQAARNKKISADNARKQKEYQAALEKNRLQAIENDKIEARNQKIQGEEDALTQNKNGLSAGKNKSRAKALKPNLTIGTGLAGSAYQGISNSGLSL